MKKIVLVMVFLAASSASAKTKVYKVPAFQETIVTSDGTPISGAYAEAEVRLHERKFSGWALIPPADMLFCEVGKAIGAAIGGFINGNAGALPSCWQIWKEDLGIKPVDQTDFEGGQLTGLNGVAQFPKNEFYLDGIVRHYTPTLEVKTKGLLTSFDYSSSFTPTPIPLTCMKRFEKPECDMIAVGKKRVQKAIQAGVNCKISLNPEQVQDLRAESVEACKAIVEKHEKEYQQSWVAYGVTGWIEAD